VTIWTDNQNTYDIFNSLRALPLYNEILKSAVDVLIANDFKLRVLLLPGKKNVVADALSRWKNADALAVHPDLLIDALRPLPSIPYKPPRVALGAAKK
jgi:predicted solute-binding protein